MHKEPNCITDSQTYGYTELAKESKKLATTFSWSVSNWTVNKTMDLTADLAAGLSQRAKLEYQQKQMQDWQTKRNQQS